jgi:hypothetical protein
MAKSYGAAWLVFALGSVALACSSDGTVADGSRPIAQFNGVPYGSKCANDSACGGQADSCCLGGKCSAEGWCSPRCKTDKECPSGFFCIDHSGTRCFSACTDDRGCPSGFVCEEKSGHNTCRFKG